MRNRDLHDALREFALESAALLTDDVRSGAELEFDVVDGARGRGRGPALYRYEPRTAGFIDERWERLRELPACARAAEELGAGAAAWLSVNGLRGEQAEPALRAMLDRLYEDATSFAFPEERFDRVYLEVEATLYRDAVAGRLLAPLEGLVLECGRLALADGLVLVAATELDGLPDAVWPEHDDREAVTLCLLERDVPAGEQIPATEAEERFRGLVTALRLWAPGGIALRSPAWRRSGDGPWTPVAIAGSGAGRGPALELELGEEDELREFLTALGDVPAASPVGWALARFEMGCERAHGAEALSDYLLGLRALLGATGETGQAGLALRVAALCAEEGMRRTVQRRIEAALVLERFVMGGGGSLGDRIGSESPRELVAAMEGHLRALLRDVLCGYLEPDLKGVADDILLEAAPEPFAVDEDPFGDEVRVAARDLRRAARADEREDEEPDAGDDPEGDDEPDADDAAADNPTADDTSELDAVTAPAGGRRQPLDGVTQSADWDWDEPEDYSAPV